MSDLLRLQKYLAQSGVSSRRGAEKLILDGKVKVNGETVTELGTKVDPQKDQVVVEGKPVNIEKKVYVLLNKPRGYVCSAKDDHAEKLVYDLVDVDQRLHSVGRLDKDTEGLIILTNDGELTQKLTHPSNEIYKTYFTVVKGKITDDEIESLKNGVIIEEDDGRRVKTSPAIVELKSRSNRTSVLDITIYEGHKRQVRKMCKAVGHPVVELKRVKEGNLTLDGLKVGQWRHLTKREIKELKDEI